MRAGTLNRRVIIERKEKTRDEIGQPVYEWVEVGTVWANIRNLRGAEFIKADAEVSAVQVSVRVRYRTDLNAGMRLRRGDTVYEIKAVLPDESRQVFVDLVCEVIY